MTKSMFLATFLVVSSTLSAHAQWPVFNQRAATVGESYLNGRARVLYGAGVYNFYTARSLTNRERAIRMRIDNHKHYAETYRQMRDDWKEWRHGDRKNWIQRRHMQLDRIEAEINLMKREERMRAAGMLPPRDRYTGWFKFNGTWWYSMDHLRASKSDYEVFQNLTKTIKGRNENARNN